MEPNIKEILRLYSTIKENKNIVEFEMDESWTQKSGVNMTSLTDDFEGLVNQLKTYVGSACSSVITSAYDATRSNQNSLHTKGMAIDIRTYDSPSAKETIEKRKTDKNYKGEPFWNQECINKALQFCNSKKSQYPGLECIHETESEKSSKDFSGQHFHFGCCRQDKKNVIDNLKSISNDTTTGDTTELPDTTDQSYGGSFEELLFGNFGLTENKEKNIMTESYFNLGNSPKFNSNRGSYTLPSSENRKIYSALEGVVNNSKYNPNCVNQITIQGKNKKGFIQYCKVSSPKVKDGDKVKVGDLIGVTQDDVDVFLYDKLFNIIPFGGNYESSIYKSETSTTSKDIKKSEEPKEPDEKPDEKPETKFTDPMTTLLFPPFMISKIAKGVKKGIDKFKEKRREKKEKEELELQNKSGNDINLSENNLKLNEEINRIKQLLK